MPYKAELVWENPPEPGRAGASGRTRELLNILEQVKERPGAWAKIAEWDGESGAYGARKRLVEKTKDFAFKFEVRKIQTEAGTGSGLWAMYEGERNRVRLPKPS